MEVPHYEKKIACLLYVFYSCDFICPKNGIVYA